MWESPVATLEAVSRALITTQERTPGTRRLLCGFFAHKLVYSSCAGKDLRSFFVPYPDRVLSSLNEGSSRGSVPAVTFVLRRGGRRLRGHLRIEGWSGFEGSHPFRKRMRKRWGTLGSWGLISGMDENYGWGCKLGFGAGVYMSDGSRHCSGSGDHGHGRRYCRAGVLRASCERHRPQIFRFLLASTRDVDLAETLTQECFLKAHRNWASFRGESSAMTWLMRIAINLQKDHWRNRRMQFWRHDADQLRGPGRGQRVAAQRRELGGAAAAGAGAGEAGVEGGEGIERTAADGVSAALRGRAGVERDCAATGLSEGTVKAHLSRAVARVRAELGGKR